jgi:anti-repressor protein
MNQLSKVFNYQNKEVRTVVINETPWFVAKDVCEILELDGTSTRRLDDDEKGLHSIHTLGGNQEMQVINEYGLYSLVLGSKKQEAKAFKRWITHDVIPSIRKHGGYLTPETIEKALTDPDTIINLATRLKEEQAKRKLLEAKIEESKPKLLFAEAVTTSKQSILVGELAKLLKQNGVDVGQNRLFEALRADGYLCRSGESYNLPTQYSMDLGLFEIKKTAINNPDGSQRITRTTKVTGKGQLYFVNKFISKQVAV